MYRCLFDVLGICFPLSSLEVGVINHLWTCPSQLHMLSWAHVGAFAYQCVWAGSAPTVPFFFSFFSVLRKNSDPDRD
jgi:hypothetical protein